MNVTYNLQQLAMAERDVIDIYRIAEERMERSAIPCDAVQLRNAFQIFRYAMREWALGNDRGVVLRALMLCDARAREVKRNYTEMVIQVEEEEIGEAIGELLKRNGYEEESHEEERR